ncbi:nonsense-mediated mRNA decay protein 2-like isoform X3 [Musa acuminata AAA Group]
MEILQRRGKALEGQVESLKATMVDLEAEAKFFDSTAAEAAEGLVEIREEYVEESEKKAPGSDSLDSKRDDMQMPDEDEEYARIMARLDELEKEELEDGSTSDADNEENLAGDEVEDDETGDEDEDAESSSSFSTSDLKHEILEIKHKSEHPVQKARGQGQEMLGSIVSKQIGGITEQPLTDQPFSGDSKMQFPAVAHSFSNSGQSISKEVSRSSSSDAKFSFSKIEDSSNSTSRQISDRVSSGHKAFTGSIIEHDLGLPPIQSAKSNLGQASVSSSSKPVSRFKMQKGNR